MEEIALKPECFLSGANMLLSPLLLTLDLPVLIKKMKQSQIWMKGSLNTMILLKDRERDVMLTTLHEETEIISFQLNDSITFQILEGSLTFNTRKTSVTLSKGQLLTLNEKVKYRLTTNEDTVLLLSIVKNSQKLILLKPEYA